MKKFIKNSAISNNYIIYDLETCGSNPYETDPIELSALVIDFATLEPKETSFKQVILPTNWDIVEDDALRVNKITREELKEKGRDQKVVFEEFVNFCRQYQKTDKLWDSLIPVGYNITNFDQIIMDRLCFRYNYLDKGAPHLFHPLHKCDLVQLMFMWFHNCDELPSYSLDNLREYFGISGEGAHRAEKDVWDSYLIFRRFMEFHRRLTPSYVNKFKGCFA